MGKQRLEYRIEQRMLAIQSLGGKCARCECTDWRVLQIDHVNGGGTRERREHPGTISLYKRVVRDAASGRYQLLCANCNWIKRFEDREHFKR